MQFIDLQAQSRRIRGNIERRIKQVLDHGKYIMGPEVAELEQKLSAYTGAKYCVSCSSGTCALLIPLMALEIGPGDAVFVPSFTFVATAEVVSLLGATPVFVDIDPKTYNIDCGALEAAITSKSVVGQGLTPKAIIAVDLFGQPADYQQLNLIAERHKLHLIEDAAQSFGATYHGKRSCSLAPIAATSFFPAKPLGCYGDGGAIFCNDQGLAEKLRSIRVHGQGVDRYDNVRVGINGRLDTIQAAILLEKLEVLEDELELRNEVASRYSSMLADSFGVPFIDSNCTSAWAQYCLLTQDRELVLERLSAAQIPSAIYYPKPLHMQGAFLAAGKKTVRLPHCETVAAQIFAVPMHPYLGIQDQDSVVRALCSAAT